MNYKYLFMLAVCLLVGCGQGSDSKTKEYDATENIVDVEDKLVIAPIDEDEVIFSSFARPYIVNDYMVLTDYRSPDKLIHIFDKNTFEYLTSTGDKGGGPYDLTNMGSGVVNEAEGRIYIADHGKSYVFDYQIDSVVAYPDYKPSVKASFREREFPNEFYYVNDTLSYGLFFHVYAADGNYTFPMAKWNMQTGEVNYMPYPGHPEITRKRSSFAVSLEHGMYVEGYHHHDLLTFCTLDGELIREVYGAEWNSELSNKMRYFDDIHICKDRIVGTYTGGENFIYENGREVRGTHPTSLVVFDLEGNYIRRLELNRAIIFTCYDKDNHRLLLTFDDAEQLGYLDLEGLIE